MYKIFRGFHLVETYQELKKAKRLAEKRIVSRGIKLLSPSWYPLYYGFSLSKHSESRG